MRNKKYGLSTRTIEREVVIVLCTVASLLSSCAGISESKKVGPEPIFVERTLIYWTQSNNGPDPDRVVLRAHPDGTEIQTIVTNERSFLGWFTAIDSISGQIFWTTVGKVHRTNLDGSGDVKKFGDYPAPKGIAIDELRRKLYLVDSSIPGILKMDLNGKNQELIIDDLFEPRGLAFDTERNTLYWTETAENKVFSLSIDSGVPEQFATAKGWPGGIAVDTVRRKVYWTESGRIVAADIDSGKVMPVISFEGSAMDIAIDSADQMIYWTNGSETAIQRARLDDPTTIETIIDTSPFSPWGITVLQKTR